ncbi:MAG: hypothetical protein ACI4GW_08280 [Lachnospiraceae bacterium]
MAVILSPRGYLDISHVGIYVGNGKMVDARGTAYGVVYRDAIAPVSSVAEPTEYQYGAEAFEAAYPKMDSVIKPEVKALIGRWVLLSISTLSSSKKTDDIFRFFCYNYLNYV